MTCIVLDSLKPQPFGVRVRAVLREYERALKRNILRHPERAVVKVCACGRTYTLDQWRKLPFHAIARHSEEVMTLPDLEMRHCVCESTISLEHYD